MRVAIFSSTAEPLDGYGNITHELTTRLHQKGVDFTLFLPKSQQGTFDLPFETQCILPEYIFRIYQPKARGYFRSIDVSQFDLVHSLFAFPYCVLAARSAKKYRKPFIMGAQGTYGVRPLTQLPERWFLKSCYAFAEAIMVPSVFTKQKIMEHAGCEYPIRVLHNGVDFQRFQKDVSSIQSQYEGKKILLTVGGLKERKGQDFVLKALQKIRQHRDDVVYLLVGEGNWKPGLQQMATDLGVADCVEFIGSKKGDELVSYFKACDVYVHTPKVVDLNFEGFGIVYLEASACGKPIVATDAGGIRDAVIDGETGLIADDGDVDGVVERIVQLLDNPEQAAAMGEAGLRYAQKNDWNSIAQDFVNLYSQAHE